MSNVIWIMQSDRPGFNLLPPEVQRLVVAAEAVGFCNFWYHPEYGLGLFADAPGSSIEDERILVTKEVIRHYAKKLGPLDMTILDAMEKVIKLAKSTGNLCYLYKESSGFVPSSEYRQDWLFQAYPGGRKILSAEGKALVDAHLATRRP